MSDTEFANMYIEKVINEVVELTKIRLMSETRIAYLEKVNAELQATVDVLNTQVKQFHDQHHDDIFEHEEPVV